MERSLFSLVVKAKTGDTEALNELLVRFRPLIRSCGRGLPDADRQDLEQELYIHLAKLIQEYKVEPVRIVGVKERRVGGNRGRTRRFLT